MSIKQRIDFMPNMWMVRAGENAFLIDDFKDLNIVAIGWQLGDLSGKSPDDIKQLVSKTYPNNSKSMGINSSQVIKFVHDFNVGDYVLSYNPSTRKYLIGKISSNYYYSDILSEKFGDEAYSNFRDVEWLGEFSRDSLNNKTKNNLNAITTIFSIKENAQKNILTVFSHTKEGKYSNEFDNEDSDDNSLKMWILPAGRSEIANEAWELFKKESYIGIGYTFGNKDVDFSTFKSLNEIKKFMGKNVVPKSYFPSTVWKFVNEFKKGDLLVVRKGLSKLAGIGVITSDFIPQTKNESKNEFDMNNIRKVNWLFTPDDLDTGRIFSGVPLVELSKYSHFWNVLLCAIARTDNDLKQKILNFLFSRFYNEYVNVDIGLKHLRKYDEENDLIQEAWRDISQKYSRGENIADDVWKRVLDRPIKVQTEGVGSVKASLKGKLKYDDSDLDKVAITFFEVVNKLKDTSDIDEQKRILEEYANNKYSKGIKTNRLTSVLNYLNPSFYVINKKSFYTYKTLNYMFGVDVKLDFDLNHYIDNNIKYKKFINQLGQAYQYPNLDITDFRIFDMFTHWMCDKKLGHYAALDSYQDMQIEKLPVSLLGDIDVPGPITKKHAPLDIKPELLESKLQGFAISGDIVNRLCASLNSGKHIIIDGTPGTGKTEIAVRFSKVASENNFIDGYVLTTATSDWSTFDTIGGLMPKEDGSLEFRQGKFLESIEKNKWLIIDEINRSDIDKAFGQLFTVLSGQDVELPYKQNGKSIKIKNWDENFCKYDEETATYYIGHNWRIIGTMNVDDKDSLFDLSYAFMRRFMFIEVDLPSPEDYKKLIEMWANDLDDYYTRKLIQIYGIVEYRKLGPAIFKDMISYIKARSELDSSNPDLVLGEAIDSYILPQLEGLNRKTIKDIEKFFDEIGLLRHISDKFGELTLDL